MNVTPVPNPRAAGSTDTQPLCAGCGSKVAPDVLKRVLGALDVPFRPDVLTGPGDDAATLEIRGVRQVLTTDHLRAFWSDPWLFGRIAALHALGDVWAMGARPQAALAQVTLPRMSEPLQERWLGEVMAAASEVFAAEGAAIVGGHSTQGSDFTVGFTVTGLEPAAGLVNAAPETGDALILTRAIGSGTILAAEMAGKAQGDDVEHLLGVLAGSQGDAARLLASDARAMTDVTGFGLAGHAARLVADREVSVELDLTAIPFFPGAEALAASGLKSTLWAANRAAVTYDGPETPASTLLFDPQTAGGFLAAVPDARAADVVKALSEIGHDAALIGQLVPRAAAEVVAR